MNIVTQQLSIEIVPQRNAEAIQYKAFPIAGKEDYFLNPVYKIAHRTSIEKGIRDIQKIVNDLLVKARSGHSRGQLGIEKSASLLSKMVIPDGGFLSIIEDGANPYLDVSAITYDIPWEALEDSAYECPDCHKPYLTYNRRCPIHNNPLQEVGHKLAMSYHLSYISRGQDRKLNQGKRFLFIKDPMGDLCVADSDPDGLCNNHFIDLLRLAQGVGYDPVLLGGANATFENVRDRLQDPSIVAIYYFGHGSFPKDSVDGCLLLAEDGELFANDIYNIAPGARFVFLNACLGAAANADWEIERSRSSLAEAFIRGNSSKVVIAPTFPMLNSQAAKSALTFFQAAFAGESCGEALRKARQESFGRYEAGEPDIAWMSYRFFGDPNRLMPSVEVAAAALHVIIADEPIRRVFDQQGRLNVDLFSFAMDEVLLRAAKRRNLQQHKHISPVDFLAGLVRRGDLTRYVLRHHQIVPDELYQGPFEKADRELGVPEQDNEAGQSFQSLASLVSNLENGTEADNQELLSIWVVKEEAQFASEVVELYNQADILAQARGLLEQICEQDVLLSFIAMPIWANLSSHIGLPTAEEVRGLLERRQREGKIDENGSIILPSLEPQARRIVDIAHHLGQQCGVCPITNRLMLVAFLQPDGSYVERCFKYIGIDPMGAYIWIFATVLLSSGMGNISSHSFGLSEEAGERVLLPMIERALARGSDAVTEREFFLDFCEVADTKFKTMLKEGLGIDLDEMRNIDLGKEPEFLKALGLEARLIVFQAHKFAQARGVFPIPNRAIFAAFLGKPDGCTARLVGQLGFVPEKILSVVLSTIGGGAQQQYSLDEVACQHAVTATVERAKSLASKLGQTVTEELFFQAFCEVSPKEFKEWLKSGLGLDLDALGHAAKSATNANLPTESSNFAIIPEQNIDDSLTRALAEAIRLARQTNWPEVRTPHLVAALIGDGNTATSAILQRNKIDPLQLKNSMLQLVPAQVAMPSGEQMPKLGSNVAGILECAVGLATDRNETKATVMDALAALLSSKGGTVGEFLHGQNINLEA